MTDTLYGRMYLAAYDTDAGAPYDRTRTGFLLRAALLAELACLGRVADTSGEVAMTDTGSTGDPVLDLVLSRVGGHRRTWKAWVRADRAETLAAVEDRLAALGLVTVAERPAFRRAARRGVTVLHAADVRALQARLTAVLRGTGPVEGYDAVVLALGAAGRVRHLVPAPDAHAHQGRLDAMTGRLDAIAPGLGRAVRGLPTTMVAAQGGMGGG